MSLNDEKWSHEHWSTCTYLRRWFIFEFSKISLSQWMNTKNTEKKTKQNVSAKNNFDIKRYLWHHVCQFYAWNKIRQIIEQKQNEGLIFCQTFTYCLMFLYTSKSISRNVSCNPIIKFSFALVGALYQKKKNSFIWHFAKSWTIKF